MRRGWRQLTGKPVAFTVPECEFGAGRLPESTPMADGDKPKSPVSAYATAFVAWLEGGEEPERGVQEAGYLALPKKSAK